MEISTKPLNIFIAKKIISPHFLFIAISFKMWAGCILSVFFKKQTKNQIKVIPQLLINLFLLYFQIDYLVTYVYSPFLNLSTKRKKITKSCKRSTRVSGIFFSR